MLITSSDALSKWRLGYPCNRMAIVMKEKDTMFELTAEMKAAALRAERDFEAGKCFSEADFKERFAKWL